MNGKDEETAFPQTSNSMWPQLQGMSLRDWFAGQALVGILHSIDFHACSYEKTAQWAYAQADEMMKAREPEE